MTEYRELVLNTSYIISIICFLFSSYIFYKFKNSINSNSKITFNLGFINFCITPNIFRTQAICWVVFLIIPYINLITAVLGIFLCSVYTIFVLIPMGIGKFCLKLLEEK
jgi:hypothetical protein